MALCYKDRSYCSESPKCRNRHLESKGYRCYTEQTAKDASAFGLPLDVAPYYIDCPKWEPINSVFIED